MELLSKSEWFILDSPLGEPEITWTGGSYVIERIVTEEGKTVWFGCGVNWIKEKNGVWTVLTENKDAKPLDKYLPDIVYGEDRIYFAPCEMPIYEKLYLENG